ncbi:MAG: hypothetical protein BMS9Abin28_2652 [Anaerolineae bacterium]|nr:MAG: hypothetical protein BMS9Abin28_2652 [Anaerolineae bacterium]
MDTRFHVGQSIKLGDGEVTPYSRATIVQIPGISGGLVWNRPAGVLVMRSDGSEADLPIRDVTRIAQIALLTIGALGGLTAWLCLGRGD